MRIKKLLAAAAVFVAPCLPSPLLANLVIDGDFQSQAPNGVFQTFGANSTMGGWKVTSGSVDLIGTYWVGNPLQSIDLAGNLNGTIEQTITTIPGTWYHLTFSMSGNPDNNHQPQPKEVSVVFGGAPQTFTFSSLVNTAGSMEWQLRSGYFQAIGTSTVLSFTDITGGANSGTPYGAAIDNVVLVAVPEPTTMIAGALLLLPFAASTMRRFRRNS